MQLTPFLEVHRHLLITWIDSEKLNKLWGGPTFQFPLTNTQLSTHYTNPNILPFLFEINHHPAGYIELYRVSEKEYRICRVFISPDFRGNHHAVEMVSLLISKATKELSCQIITLGVYSHNTAAIACYKKLGFSTYKQVKNSTQYKGQSWDLIAMQKRTGKDNLPALIKAMFIKWRKNSD